LKRTEDSVETGIDYEHRKAKEVKVLLNNDRNDCIQTLLQGLTPAESGYSSLWKATKKLKRVKKKTSTA
jgi:hypothetical protein